ncbi:uncharacterized protein LOC109491308 [Ailuropoda melanoleuca]|uniref:uncharacterized protein LOC109491308 n=1 Tax=Ailuropoda melanoleuca TaxID=9646 RepID=UPI001494AD14|nr:uncharacterized protein LOC109491308 [Ailuropoda melanoleuca]
MFSGRSSGTLQWTSHFFPSLRGASGHNGLTGGFLPSTETSAVVGSLRPAACWGAHRGRPCGRKGSPYHTGQLHPAVRVADLLQHINQMKTAEGYGFKQEYEDFCQGWDAMRKMPARRPMADNPDRGPRTWGSQLEAVSRGLGRETQGSSSTQP